jgi:phosphate transport system substrate-binding protein
LQCHVHSILRSLVLVVGFSTAALGQPHPAVDSALPVYAGGQKASGHVTISGSDTMQPLMLRLASEFRRHQPDVKVALEGGGSEAAIERFVQGIALVRTGEGNDSGHDGARQAVFLASSRELTPEEMHEFVSRYGYEPIPLQIAVDAVAIYVHRDNPLRGLTLSELDAILSRAPKRGIHRNFERWGDVGLTGDWSDAPIHLYGRDLNSGTRAFVKEQVLRHTEFRSSVQEVPGAASMILAISRDRLALGYGGIGWQVSGVRAVPLAESAGQQFMAPSRSSASDASYPLRRPLYLYVNKAATQAFGSGAREFLRFVYSRQGQEAVVKAGFYPLRHEQRPRILADLVSPR